MEKTLNRNLSERNCKQKRRVSSSTPWGVIKKSAYAHSALITNRQFRAHIARMECGHFNEVRIKHTFCDNRRSA